MSAKLTDSEKELYSLVLPAFGAVLTESETAAMIKSSKPTLYRMREQGIGPSYNKGNSKGKNGSIRYPLHEVIKYITRHNIQTMEVS